MTAAPPHERVSRLEAGGVGQLAALLERDALAHQYLLDALDRGERGRFLVWPSLRPVAVLFASPTGTLVPAGDASAGPVLAEAADRLGWRVLVGDAGIGRALLASTARGLFRRRVTQREQRFMAVEAHEVRGRCLPGVDGMRAAGRHDIDALVEMACRLHVEDRMGPPIARSARSSVRSRMLESIGRQATWVVERDGVAVAKADLSLRSGRRGAQVAGVYVDSAARGQGLASGLLAGLVRMLVDEGQPAVSLHVRADNAPALAAYRRAGLSDRAAWVLALR